MLIWQVVELVFASVAITGIVLWLGAVCRQRASWHPDAKRTAEFAKTVNLPRKPQESLSEWEARIVAALKELSLAGDEFLAAARREGSVEYVGARGERWSLPADHPAAIRYAKAKGEDAHELRNK